MRSWLFVPLLVIAAALRIYFRREKYSRMGRLWRLPVRTRGQLWSRICLVVGIAVLGLVFAVLIVRGVLGVTLPLWVKPAVLPVAYVGMALAFIGAFTLGWTSDGNGLTSHRARSNRE